MGNTNQALLSTLSCLIAAGLGALPAPAETLEQRQWEHVSLHYGMFLHFNMSTFTERMWAVPLLDPNIFNPISLDTDQWAQAAREAGMRYGFLTAKHHDGFALWDSKVPSPFFGGAETSYDVASTQWHAAETAAGRSGDIVKRFADSFREKGLGVALYYSIWDRTNAIATKPNPQPQRGMSPDEQWGVLSAAEATNYVVSQLTELLGTPGNRPYGEIEALWFDAWLVGLDLQYVHYRTVYDHVKTISPRTLVILNQHPISRSDILEIERKSLPADNELPAEAAHIINNLGWFWKTTMNAANDQSPQWITAMRRETNQRNGTFLLNVSPDLSGQVPAHQVQVLADAAPIEGDVDQDDNLDADDIDRLYAEWASPARWGPADLDWDRDVDAEDARVLVEDLLATGFGDANLDGIIDILDVGFVASGFGNQTGWSAGNFDGKDGTTIIDWSLLAGNFGRDFKASESLASGIVSPEPGAQAIVLFGTLMLWSCRRRRRRLSEERLGSRPSRIGFSRRTSFTRSVITMQT